MVDVTARLARPIGRDSFTDLTDTTGAPLIASGPKRNPDGTATVTFDCTVDPLVLAVVKRRMESRDDIEAAAREALEALLVSVEATAPGNDNVGLLRDAVLAIGELVLRTD